MVSTHLKKHCQIASFPQMGMNIYKNLWNHHPVYIISKKSPTGSTEWTPKPEYLSSSTLLRGPLVRSHWIFDGLNFLAWLCVTKSPYDIVASGLHPVATMDIVASTRDLLRTSYDTTWQSCRCGGCPYIISCATEPLIEHFQKGRF